MPWPTPAPIRRSPLRCCAGAGPRHGALRRAGRGPGGPGRPSPTTPSPAPSGAMASRSSALPLERQLDIIARELGLDPWELRMRNAMRPGDRDQHRPGHGMRPTCRRSSRPDGARPQLLDAEDWAAGRLEPVPGLPAGLGHGRHLLRAGAHRPRGHRRGDPAPRPRMGTSTCSSAAPTPARARTRRMAAAGRPAAWACRWIGCA